MGRRGPAPKPKPLRDVDGGASHRPEVPNQPDPPKGQIDPPAWLDGEALELWHRCVPSLQVTGLARPIDAGVLARYCDMWAEWLECRRIIAKHGPDGVIRAESKEKGKLGRITSYRELPATSRKRKLHQMLIVLEREFGLTPAARTRITADLDKGAGGNSNELMARFGVGHLRLSGTS
jgi:P27 family predicted phage terminase small subunit